MTTSNRQARVVAVCLSATSGIPKYPQPYVVVGPQGVEGDYHAGPVDRHRKEGPPQPNTRQVSVVAREAFDAVARDLGVTLAPGALAENVLLEGLGDLSDLEPGDRLLLGQEVVLEVTAQNKPCSTLTPHHPDIVRALKGRRGVVAVVVRPGVVRPGDEGKVVRARQA